MVRHYGRLLLGKLAALAAVAGMISTTLPDAPCECGQFAPLGAIAVTSPQTQRASCRCAGTGCHPTAARSCCGRPPASGTSSGSHLNQRGAPANSCRCGASCCCSGQPRESLPVPPKSGRSAGIEIAVSAAPCAATLALPGPAWSISDLGQQTSRPGHVGLCVQLCRLTV